MTNTLINIKGELWEFQGNGFELINNIVKDYPNEKIILFGFKDGERIIKLDRRTQSTWVKGGSATFKNKKHSNTGR